jgi:hypothetical protein
MSNNYASYYVPPSSVQYDNYVCAQTTGPLNTSQTPSQIGYHSYGILIGKHPNPPKYYPADGSSEFSQARRQYLAADSSKIQQMIAQAKVIANSKASTFFSASSQRQIGIGSTHMNYITPPPSSMYTSIRKRQAVGKSSYKSTLPVDVPLSFKSHNSNDVRTSLRMLRGAGCVAPAKKGSIFNRTCTAGGGVCNPGAYAGQGY